MDAYIQLSKYGQFEGNFLPVALPQKDQNDPSRDLRQKLPGIDSVRMGTPIPIHSLQGFVLTLFSELIANVWTGFRVV